MRLRFLHPLCGALALAGAFSAALPAAAQPRPAPEPKVVVQDPHYGDTLFRFYQQQYFGAITGLMASQHFERVPRHADEAEILRGGMLLSYGLHQQAGDIFHRLVDQAAAPAVRDRAWHFLAKLRFQRGLPDEADAALARVGNALPAELAEDHALLRAQVHMARGDFAAAAEVLRPLAGPDGGHRYARFNLGVALVRAGDAPAGSALLDQLGRAPAENEEFRALRDKANLALGFAALQAQQPEAARRSLERVRLAGAQSAKALLGFGWAAAALKEHQAALVPWLELAGRDPSDAAVLEARIAVPYAYAELGAYGQAVAGYEAALADFGREAAALDESIAAVRAGRLVNALAQRNPGADMGWFYRLQDLPEAADLPHAGHLASVLAEHDFQEAFKNWRDLLFLQRNLADWATNLGVFGDMLDNRRKAFEVKAPQVQSGAGRIDLGGAAQRVATLAADLQRADDTRDAAALADAREHALQARITRVQAGLARLGGHEQEAALRERLRLAAGALAWEQARELAPRLWQARKAERVIQHELAQAQQRQAALAQSLRDEPQRLAGFGQRLATQGQRLAALAPRVATLAQQQQAAVQDIAVAALQRQKERLAVYTTQARFALAQLNDRASLAAADAKERADAPAQ